MVSHHSAGTRTKPFCDAVRARDRKCVITGEEVPEADLDIWDGFQAAHIFPLALEDLWTRHNYSRCITQSLVTGGTINSVQNGVLLRNDIHDLFDSYIISINPDVCIS